MAPTTIQNEEPAVDSFGNSDPKNCRYTDRRPNLWDMFLFGDLTGVIFRGARQTLEAKDLNPLHTSFTAKNTSERILRLFSKKRLQAQQQRRPNADNDNETLIHEEAKAPKINMVMLVIRAFWPFFLLTFILSMLHTVILLTPPALLGYFYDFVSNPNANDDIGYYVAGALVLAQQAESLLLSHIYHTLYNIGFKCRSGFSSAIYQKTLRLSPKATKEFSTGDIVNLVAADLENVMGCVMMSVTIYSAPLSIFLTFVLIYQYLGWYCLPGAVAILIFTPINVLAVKVEASLQGKSMKSKDERIALVTEIINSIRVIKLYAWESSFMKRIRNIRKREARFMNIYLAACNVFAFIWNCNPLITSTAAISAYLFLNKSDVLDPKKILVSISYFNAMKADLTSLPFSVSVLTKCIVSLRRLRNFLEADEIDTTMIKDDLAFDEEIALRNATLSWTEDETPVLKGVDLEVRKGELVAVVGTVAAGKSSLIQSIIGEMKVLNGSVNRKKSSTLAYVPQQAWILNETIKGNILFGSHPRSRYQDIVNKCCLVPDLKIFPAGDATEIGEKGVNLSGGQKQRISLARAVYQDADIYLLDDPLSAVDAHVARSLFNDIIGPQGLLAKKTRLLVTHTVSVLPFVDRIVILEEGKITHQGTYEEIMQQNIKLKELVESHSATDEVSEEADPSAEGRKRFLSNRTDSEPDESGIERQNSERPDGRIIQEEEMQIGKVRWRVYLEFIWNFGIIGTLVTICGYTLYQVAANGSLYFISLWGQRMKDNNGTTTEDAVKNMEIYLAFGGAQAASMLGALTTLSLGCIWTSTSLHNRMLDAVLKAPMSFFDSTPVGRILNRFSRDVYDLDFALYSTIQNYLDIVAQYAVVIVLICIKLPLYLALLVPLMLVFMVIQKFYMGSSRQIKRLNATTKSPVLNSLNETLSGTTSIRAYASQHNFVQNNMRLLDNNQNCVVHEYSGYRWLAVRLNVIGSLLCGAVVVLITHNRRGMSAVLATLIVNFAMQATFSLSWIVRFGTQLENAFVATERVLEYTKLKSEARWFIKGDVDPQWPDQGGVVFDEYSTRYRENLDLVIKQISLQINPREKVGIVGRTGAGKSSLTLALLRIIEAAEGRILIDGIDISKIGLHSLRSRIGIIPQDPILFKGTLRRNVDPEEKYTDEEIWSALRKSHLKTKENGIDYEVEEGGTNLSVGERQLVCLARALLRNSKLLILDEATAAVDLETDALIQRTIRDDFKNSTVITIAHRLHTIMDYDKIVVMDKGRIVEVGPPQNLLQNPDGLFTVLAKDANIRSDV